MVNAKHTAEQSISEERRSANVVSRCGTFVPDDAVALLDLFGSLSEIRR